MNYARHIDEDYARLMGWRDVRPVAADDSGMTVVATNAKGEHVHVTAKLVAHGNARRFRNWATFNKSHWETVIAPQPAGRRYYTLMVGLSEDGETPWWTAIIANEVLVAHQESIQRMEGRDWFWYRMDPEDAPGMVVATYDFTEPEKGAQLTPPTNREPAPVAERLTAPPTPVAAVSVASRGNGDKAGGGVPVAAGQIAAFGDDVAAVGRRGVPWIEQIATVSDSNIYQQIYEAALEGHLVREEWDHNHPNYRPERSNKQLKLVAQRLAGRELTFDEAWRLMVRNAFALRGWA